MIELGCVWAAVVLGLAYLDRVGADSWGPVVLVTGVVIPALVGCRPMPSFVNREGLRGDLRLVLTWGLGLIVIGFIICRLLSRSGLLPIQPRPSGLWAWLSWQCLVVAPSEELFFRGYIQAQWPGRSSGGLRGNIAAIIGSSTLFACAHVVVRGQPSAAMTFVPGLVMGWLYAMTGRLIAPTIFHGLANLSWALM